MRLSWIAAAGLTLSLFVSTARADVFNGAWLLKFTPDHASSELGATEFKDAALFHDNQLSAEAIAMYGFNTVAYAINPDSSSVFTATMTSQTQGTMQWAGRKEGGRVTGLLVWTKPDGKVHKYTFSGTAFDSDNTGGN